MSLFSTGALVVMAMSFCTGYTVAEEQYIDEPFPTPALESYEVREHYERELNDIDPAYTWTCEHKYANRYDSVIFCIGVGDGDQVTMLKLIEGSGRSVTFQRVMEPLGPVPSVLESILDDRGIPEKPDVETMECKYTDVSECNGVMTMNYDDGLDWIWDLKGQYTRHRLGREHHGDTGRSWTTLLGAPAPVTTVASAQFPLLAGHGRLIRDCTIIG